MRRWSLALSITGFVTAVLMSITLLVFWNVYIIGDFRTIRELSQTLGQLRHAGNPHHDPTVRWTVLATGSAFFTVILVAQSLFFAGFLVQRKYRRRQIDWLNLTTHELKLPTANIQLFAQTLRRRRLSEADQERFLDLVLQEARRLDGMITRILQARRIETGMQEVQRESLDLRAWLEGVPLSRPDMVFRLLPGPSPFVSADPRLLEIALDNLVQNAHKYGGGLAPEVSLRSEGGYATVEVRDRGVGVPPACRKKLFHRFYRVPDREHRRRTGTGLGLHIVRLVVQRLHGGAVGHRDPEEGVGSVFWFRLAEVA